MAGGQQRGRVHKKVNYAKYGYFFIAPFFLIFLIFQLGPLLYTVGLSFFEYYKHGFHEIGPNFVGFRNFTDVLIDTSGNWFQTDTFRALGNTMLIWLSNFVPQILLSLLLASWFTNTRVKLRGQGAYKVIIFMPNIITAASISVLFYSMFNSAGPMTVILRNAGIIAKNFDFMNDKMATRAIISFILFWMWYGNTMIILIAGILGIDPSLFEAAQVDGATGGQIFRRITLPLLKPIVLFTLVTSAVGGLQVYDIPAVFNVNQGGDGLPDFASTTITMYIKKLTLTSSNYGKASAASMMLFLVTCIISVFFFFVLADRDKKPKKNKKAKEA
ncbi:possible alpha-xyloside ABC transporter, permease component [Lachnospiraceae bacterium KM106-2]|nr:possible alpha-xyloside ABC transporter, permease component [Lachnospiraceae bacterium KM106-2]